MLFFIALVAADFFKFAGEDRYLGMVGDELRKVPKGKGTSFLRQQANEQKYLTLIKIADERSVGFDDGDRGVVNMDHSKNEFTIALDLNGKYALINKDKCLYAKDGLVRRGDCNNPSEVSYFDITARPEPFEVIRRTTVSAGDKLDGFNPDDPLAVSPRGIPVSEDAKNKILYPYRLRLEGAPNTKIEDPKDAKRVLVKFNTL